MASFYLDEDVTERLLTPLQAHGHDATSVGRLGRKGLSDALQLLFAAQSDRIMLTHNARDYILLQEAWTAWAGAWGAAAAARHSGILIIYTSHGLTVADIANVATFDNRLFAWHLTGGWNEIT